MEADLERLAFIFAKEKVERKKISRDDGRFFYFAIVYFLRKEALKVLLVIR
jgi:hypothetical protein